MAFPSFLNASHECDQRPKCRRPTGCPQSVWSAHPPQAVTISCCRFPSRTLVLDLPVAVGCCDISRFPSPICKEASNCGLRSEEGRGGGVESLGTLLLPPSSHSKFADCWGREGAGAVIRLAWQFGKELPTCQPHLEMVLCIRRRVHAMLPCHRDQR